MTDKTAQIQVRDLRNGEWYWIHKKVIKDFAPNIGAIGLALYNIYCYFSNHNNGVAHPSIETIEKTLNLTKPTIWKYNKVLQAQGLIRVVSGKGRKKVNEVYLLKIKVNDVSKKVNDVSKKVNDVNTEQELITRINNKKGKVLLKQKLISLGLK